MTMRSQRDIKTPWVDGARCARGEAGPKTLLARGPARPPRAPGDCRPMGLARYPEVPHQNTVLRHIERP